MRIGAVSFSMTPLSTSITLHFTSPFSVNLFASTTSIWATSLWMSLHTTKISHRSVKFSTDFLGVNFFTLTTTTELTIISIMSIVFTDFTNHRTVLN